MLRLKRNPSAAAQGEIAAAATTYIEGKSWGTRQKQFRAERGRWHPDGISVAKDDFTIE